MAGYGLRVHAFLFVPRRTAETDVLSKILIAA
jgi:hypothetical protein